MGMVAILFSGAKPFEQIVSYLSIEDPMWNLVKIACPVSEKKTFKYYIILYTYIAQGLINNPQRDKILIVTKRFYYFNHTLQISAISL